MGRLRGAAPLAHLWARRLAHPCAYCLFSPRWLLFLLSGADHHWRGGDRTAVLFPDPDGVGPKRIRKRPPQADAPPTGRNLLRRADRPAPRPKGPTPARFPGVEDQRVVLLHGTSHNVTLPPRPQVLPKTFP